MNTETNTTAGAWTMPPYVAPIDRGSFVYRMTPGIGPEILAWVTPDRGVLVPGADGKWKEHVLSEPTPAFSAALRAGEVPMAD